MGILRKMQIKSERFGSHRVEYLNLCEFNSLNSNTKSSNYGPRHLLLYNYCINMAIASIAAILNSQSITRVGLLAEWTLLVLFYILYCLDCPEWSLYIMSPASPSFQGPSRSLIKIEFNGQMKPINHVEGDAQI